VKQVYADVATLAGGRKRLRVGVVGSNNNALIASGPLYRCRFAIAAAGAPSSVALLNTPEAAGPQANPVAVVGSDGRIDVVAAPPTLELGAATAAAGGTVLVTASLQARGAAIAALATDIHFVTALLSVVEVGGEPDCTLTTAGAALDKELVATGLPDGAGQALLRVGLLGRDNNTALPSTGTVALFQCRFLVQPGASGTISLEHSPEGAAPNAQPVGLTGQPGSITVQ
jgi:hypothetical protein